MSEKLKIALIGNPNTGKSSLFNALTGMNQKIANFPGVTVEKSIGYFNLDKNTPVQLIDLPGTYSLFPKSADEAVPFEILINPQHEQYPNLVVYIADAANLKRHLVLLTQIIDLRFPVILALNMIDQAEAQGTIIDVELLSRKLGIPVVAMNARKKVGIDALIKEIKKGTDVPAASFIDPSKAEPIPQDVLREKLHLCNTYHALLKLHHQLKNPKKEKALVGVGAGKNTLQDIKSEFKFDSGVWQREDLLYRYKKVNEIVDACVKVQQDSLYRARQSKIDAVLTHKVGGYLIFFAILFIVFQAIFTWAEYPMMLIEDGLGWVQAQINTHLPEGVLNDLITGGILSGLAGVLVFIPQIAFLFFFISIMEDTGYLARVAFLMDNLMRKFGLNGKSVIPLISGTACAVPAILATRSIDNTRSRLITILVTPLISCSARLPVYILLIGLIIPDITVFGIFNLKGLVLMGMYLLGFFAAIGAAYLFHIIMKVTEKQYFFLEMPVYRSPNWQNVGMTVYRKVRTFVVEAGKIIIAVSIILWFLASYGPPGAFDKIDKKYETLQKEQKISEAEAAQHARSEKLENSFVGMIGRTIEPVIAPLGYDWKIGIALITSFAAREVFVGTVATLYGLEDEDPDLGKLKESMLASRDKNGRVIYSFATVISLLIFYAFALQCVSTIAVTLRETGSWKWTLAQLGFMTALAYLGSLIVYQSLS